MQATSEPKYSILNVFIVSTTRHTKKLIQIMEKIMNTSPVNRPY